MNRSDLIDKYIQKTASADELEHISQLMKDDPEFRADVVFHKALRKAIIKEESEQLKQRLQTLERPPKSWRLKSQLWKIAAVLVVGVGLWWVFFNVSADYELLYRQHFEPYPNIVAPVVRGTDPTQSKMKIAFRLYDNHEYAKAAEAFSDLYETERAGYANFYHAVSLMADDRVRAAISVLERPDWEVPNNYRSQTAWYLALGYLKMGDTSQAINYLDQVIENDGAMAAEAHAICAKID